VKLVRADASNGMTRRWDLVARKKRVVGSQSTRRDTIILTQKGRQP
jgi:hypothetical protein